MSDDLLEALLRTALAENALDEGGLPRFAAALRARAELILAQQVADLKREREALITQKQAGDVAHERLLEHHHATLRRIVQALEPLPAELPWSYRRVRAQIEGLLEVLRKEDA